MRVVWKYPLTQAEQTLQVPDAGIMESGPVRAVAWQHGNPTLWIEVNPEGKSRLRRFRVVATGEPFEPRSPRGFEATYVGSAVSDALVFHVYELPPEGS